MNVLIKDLKNVSYNIGGVERIILPDEFSFKLKTTYGYILILKNNVNEVKVLNQQNEFMTLIKK